jgi:hypothetical protein
MVSVERRPSTPLRVTESDRLKIFFIKKPGIDVGGHEAGGACHGERSRTMTGRFRSRHSRAGGNPIYNTGDPSGHTQRWPGKT